MKRNITVSTCFFNAECPSSQARRKLLGRANKNHFSCLLRNITQIEVVLAHKLEKLRQSITKYIHGVANRNKSDMITLV